MSHVSFLCHPLPFPKLVFMGMQYKTFENTLREKKKLLIKCNTPYSHSVLYPYGEAPTIFIKLKFVIWERYTKLLTSCIAISQTMPRKETCAKDSG